MAEKLSVQIALDGGKEIERQLADIGKAGRDAFVEIAKAADQVGGFDKIKPEVVTQKLKDLGVTGKEAIDKIHAAVQQAGRLEGVVKGIQSVENAFAGLLTGVRALSAALGPIALILTAIGSAAVAVADSTIKFAESINKATAEAQKLGLTFEQFKKLRDGLQAIGLSAEEASSGIAHIAGTLDKVNVERVKELSTTLQNIPFRNLSDQAQTLIRDLQVMGAQGGEAGKLARAELDRLGLAAVDAAQSVRILATIGGEISTERMDAIVNLLRQIPNETQRAAVAFETLGANAGAALQRANTPAGQLQNAINNLRTAVDGLNSLTFAPLLISGINATTAAINALNQWLQTISWDAFATGAMTAIERVLGGFAMMGTELAGFASQLASFAWDAFAGAGVAAWNAITGAIQNAINAVLRFLGLKSQADAGGGGGSGFAHGGRVGGRGTGTSDSNLAWLSRGEYVTPARAVAQPGVLAFLEALRRSGGNLRRVLDGMGRFALGGMVPRALPAFAAGGLNSMSNVTIQFPGLPAIGGLRASSDVVDELRKAAALAQVRSGGRKPSRYS